MTAGNATMAEPGDPKLVEELDHLKGIMSQLLQSRTSDGAPDNWKMLESATSELNQVEQQLVEVSKRCSVNNAGTQSMITGIQDLEKQVQGTVMQLATVPAELEHKLRLVSAQKQAVEARHEAEKSNLEHRVFVMRERMAEMREQMMNWEERFTAESSRLSTEKANQAAVCERLQLELVECRGKLAQVSTERDNFSIQISKLQERLVQTEAAKGQLLTRAETLKDSEMEKVRGLLSKANTREAELLNELQTCRTSRNGRVNEAQTEVHRLTLQLREVQETASRERDHLLRQLKKLQADHSTSQTRPGSQGAAEQLQHELTTLSTRLQSSTHHGGVGSMVATMATHVHAASVVLEAVSRYGDGIMRLDHPEHQVVKLACEPLGRLDSHQHLLVSQLQSEMAEVEAARESELAGSRATWVQLEHQLISTQQRLGVSQAEAAKLHCRINLLESQLVEPTNKQPLTTANPSATPNHDDETLLCLQQALKEAIAEQVHMAEECAKLEAECKTISFDMLDTNADGVIDRTEYVSVFAKPANS